MDMISKKLLEWYQANGRQLPWRRNRDPYAIWIAEIMLQQTRVETALPYYRRWMERFPTVEDVASATLDEVLKLWEGLGYYRRARHLHQAAQKIIQHHHGQLPSKPQILKELPGVGEYTAAAIGAIAFDQDIIALDGNLKRVLARLFNIQLDIRSTQTHRILRELARDILPEGQASDFNQALMDLGATICSPKSPNCSECPLTAQCLAFQQGVQEALPLRQARKKIPRRQRAVGVVQRGQQVLLGRRPSEGLLAGLWEFPGVELEEEADPETALSSWLHHSLGVQTIGWQAAGVREHTYSHFKVTAQVLKATWISGEPSSDFHTELKWMSIKDLERVPMGKIDRSIAAQIEGKRKH